MANEYDEAIEKVLAALKAAVPPEGMDERIAQRLKRDTAAMSQASWRDVLAGSSLAGAWWRGALSGAAVAAVAVGLVLLAPHRSANARGERQTPPAVATTTPQATNPVATAVALPHPAPCTSPSMIPAHKVFAPPSLTATSPVASPDDMVQRSHPAPSQPPTTEERDLVRLAHIAGPHQLATLNPEIEAKLQAQEEADFTKFFTPPPRPKPVDENE
jgi:hypothetical protein